MEIKSVNGSCDDNKYDYRHHNAHVEMLCLPCFPLINEATWLRPTRNGLLASAREYALIYLLSSWLFGGIHEPVRLETKSNFCFVFFNGLSHEALSRYPHMSRLLDATRTIQAFAYRQPDLH